MIPSPNVDSDQLEENDAAQAADILRAKLTPLSAPPVGSSVREGVALTSMRGEIFDLAIRTLLLPPSAEDHPVNFDLAGDRFSMVVEDSELAFRIDLPMAPGAPHMRFGVSYGPLARLAAVLARGGTEQLFLSFHADQDVLKIYDYDPAQPPPRSGGCALCLPAWNVPDARVDQGMSVASARPLAAKDLSRVLKVGLTFCRMDPRQSRLPLQIRTGELFAGEGRGTCLATSEALEGLDLRLDVKTAVALRRALTRLGGDQACLEWAEGGSAYRLRSGPCSFYFPSAASAAPPPHKIFAAARAGAVTVEWMALELALAGVSIPDVKRTASVDVKLADGNIELKVELGRNKAVSTCRASRIATPVDTIAAGGAEISVSLRDLEAAVDTVHGDPSLELSWAVAANGSVRALILEADCPGYRYQAVLPAMAHSAPRPSEARAISSTGS